MENRNNEDIYSNGNYIVKRRGTTVTPIEVEYSNKLNKGLSIVFLCWSVVVIICYFSNVNIPEYIDISISILAITVSCAYYTYKYFTYKNHKLDAVSPAPKEKERKQAIRNVSPIDFTNLEEIKLDI
jgi:hypothetical protein